MPYNHKIGKIKGDDFLLGFEFFILWFPQKPFLFLLDVFYFVAEPLCIMVHFLLVYFLLFFYGICETVPVVKDTYLLRRDKAIVPLLEADLVLVFIDNGLLLLIYILIVHIGVVAFFPELIQKCFVYVWILR